MNRFFTLSDLGSVAQQWNELQITCFASFIKLSYKPLRFDNFSFSTLDNQADCLIWLLVKTGEISYFISFLAFIKGSLLSTCNLSYSNLTKILDNCSCMMKVTKVLVSCTFQTGSELSSFHGLNR